MKTWHWWGFPEAFWGLIPPFMSQIDLIPPASVPPAPERAAGLERLKAFTPLMGRHYASRRNFDFGPADRSNISGLSAHVRHRLVLESEVAAAALAAHGYEGAEKFIQEVCWRTYWKGWLEQRPAVWTAYRRDRDRALSQLETDTDMRTRYDNAVSAQTGLSCFDVWMRELIETGYLHNHARMWFASLWVYTLNLPWVLGADLFLRHLIDGDAASNTLSWRWVCGLQTAGKTYLARASNINKYTGGRFQIEGYDLAREAPPLDPAVTHPPASPLEPGSPLDRSQPVILWLHEEDLHPESWNISDMDIRAIVYSPDPQPRGPLPLGEAASAFTRQAIKDGVTRASKVMDASFHPVQSAEEIMALARSCAVRTVVTQRIHQGPLNDETAPWRTAITHAGFEVKDLRRRWDEAFYPHALKGFFKLKKAIKPVMAHLGMM